MKRKLLTFVTVFFVFSLFFCVRAYAEFGKCGDNVYWILDDDGVMTISGSGAMYNCEESAPLIPSWANVKEVIIENGVTVIGEYTFYGCKTLEKVAIPDSVVFIGKGALRECTGLRRIYIPMSVEIPMSSKYKDIWIDEMPFKGCSNLVIYCEALSDTYYTAKNPYWNVRDYDYTYSSGSLKTNYYYLKVYDGCSRDEYNFFTSIPSGQEIIVPNSVSYILPNAFYNRSSMKSITIPITVTKIGENAFSGCTNLQDVYYPGTQEDALEISIEKGNEHLTYATWHLTYGPKFTINYDANGGSNAPAAQTKTQGVALTLSSDIPVRENYDFIGWATIESTDTEYQPGDRFTKDIDTTLFAVWKLKSYTVSYEANGGSGAPDSQTKAHGTDLTLSTIMPTRADSEAGSYTVTLNANGGSVRPSTLTADRTTSYHFKDWNTSEDGSGTSYAPGASYTDNAAVTLYAQWDSSITTATVTLPVPICDSYSFKGWNTSDNAIAGITGIYRPSSDITLYAVWGTYTVNYDANGGNGAPAAQTKPHGEILTLRSKAPKREGYNFLGWATSADATVAEYQPGDDFIINEDTTLYAIWIRKPHTVTFDTNGGYSLNAQSVPDGEKAARPDNPTKGYAVFIGWYSDNTLLTAFDFDTIITSDITLHAKWHEPDLILPSALTAIGDEAFTGGVFTYVKLSETTTTIGSLAFADCPNLTYIYIPEATKTIDRFAFADVSGLTIIGKSGSTAEDFAKARGFAFIEIS